MSLFKVYIVEDNIWYGELLKYNLSLNPDYEVTLFENAKDCLANLNNEPDVISIDLNLPDMTGDELFSRIKKYNSEISILVISGQNDISIATELIRKGATDYFLKDDNTKDLLWRAVQKIWDNKILKTQIENLKIQLEEKFDFEKTIIGQSEAIKKTFLLIEKAIKSNINVSISGDTGTGKEVVAKAIHFNSTRSKKPFIALNMSAIPGELLESELFGFEQGAFTGANNRKIGKFEEANGGTLLLDEIAELDLNLQSKLLRVLQEKEFSRLGSNELIKLDARLIIATHKNLADEVKKGNFREDLYYRIIGLPIYLPPLRERGRDFLILAKGFIEQFSKENKMSPILLTESAIFKLQTYKFPGNIRELKSIIELACLMSNGKEILEADITFMTLNDGDFLNQSEKKMKEYTIEIISFFLRKYNGNVIEVAKKLDIGKSTIYNFIKSGKIKN